MSENSTAASDVKRKALKHSEEKDRYLTLLFFEWEYNPRADKLLKGLY